MGTTLLNLSLLLFIGLAVPLAAGDVCTFPSPFTLGGVPGAAQPISAVRACFNAVPFLPSIRNRTVAVLRDLFSLYSFTDIVSRSGPPYLSNVDVTAELNRISTTAYPSDYAMVIDLQRFYNRLNDAHTIYQAPPPYANWFVIRPFRIDATSPSSGGIRFTVGGEVAAYGAPWSLFHNLAFGSQPNLSPHVGKIITRINNVDPLAYIQQYADAGGFYRSPGVRLNAALKQDFYYGFLDLTPRLNTSDSETYTFSDGTSVTLSLPVVSSNLVFTDIPSLQRGLLPPASRREDSASPEGPDNHRPMHRELEEFGFRPFETKKVRQQRRRIAFTEAQPTEEVEQRDSETHELASRVLTPIAVSNDSSVVAASTTINGKRYVVLVISSFSESSTAFATWTRSFQSTIRAAVDFGRANNITELLIDLSNNGGGYICLQSYTLAALFSPINANKPLGTVSRDIRLSGGPNSRYGRLVREYWGSRLSIPCTSTAINSVSQWLDPPALLTRGNFVGNYTRINDLDCFRGVETTFDYANINWTPNYFFRKVVILTDGTCGSSCAQFLTTAMTTGGATVLSYGGRPSETMDTASFAGGNVELWSTFVSRANIYSATTGLTLSNLPTTASTSFNFAEGYAPGGTIPRDFTRLPAAATLPIWPRQFLNTDDLYAAAVPYFECAATTASSIPCVVPVPGNSAV